MAHMIVKFTDLVNPVPHAATPRVFEEASRLVG